MDDKAIEREIAVGKVEQAFGLFIDRFTHDVPSNDRGRVASMASDYFAGMVAGIALDPGASAEDIAEVAPRGLAIVSIAKISGDESFIRKMVSKVAEIMG